MNRTKFLYELWEPIPAVQHLELAIVEATGSAVQFLLPHAPNKNDKNTAFAGSLYSALVLSGWSLLNLAAMESDLSGEIMIVESRSHFRRAVRSDCIVSCVLVDNPFQRYAGKPFYTELTSTAREDDAVCVELHGRYYFREPKS